MDLDTRYFANDTMKLLEHQTTLNREAAADIENAINAYLAAGVEKQTACSIGIDFFNLGYIYGKRAERKRRKAISKQ